MQSRYHAPRALHELPLGWGPPSGQSGFRLMLEHLRRRAALRRRQPMPESRLRYLLGSLAGWPRQAAWLRWVAASRDVRAAAELNPRLYERWRSHYISRGLDPAMRGRIVEAHYRFITREFPERLRERLLKGHDVRLATLPLGEGRMAYLHARAPEDERSGELGLYLLNGDKEVVSSCAITFAGADGLLIGAVRGSWAYLGRGAMAGFTRASGGMRPRDLLLSVVRALATYYGIQRIRGVSDAARPVERRADGASTAHDPFWRRHGGTPGEDGFYEIPRLPVVTARAHVEAFGREACEVTLRAFARQA